MKYTWIPIKATTCLIMGVFCGVSAVAQTDTIQLAEVVILANDPSRFLPGGKQVDIRPDTANLESLAQALEAQLPISFVQYGAPGQLASINLRGLGAARTSLRWQGMEINSFSLGQTDFSQIPVESSDLIKVSYGGVGAMFGNGALGGTVDLNSNPNYQNGHTVSLNTSFGSFGFWGTSLGYSYGNKKFSSSTRIFQHQAQNDFKYELNHNTHRQRNAGYEHYGVVQDLRFLINPSNELSLHFWYNKHHREIQPSKNDFSGDEQLDNENSRFALAWRWSKQQWSGKLQTGYTRDFQLFNQTEKIQVDRWFGSFEFQWEKSDKFEFLAGGNVNHLTPSVDTYQENSKELRSDLYLSGLWKPIQKITLGLGIRTPMLDGNIKAVSPLLSGAYRVLTSNKIKLSLDLQLSQSYRLPTLNSLYWNPGGNPGLKAETSNNIETGIGFSYKKRQLTLDSQINYFRHAVDNWILWIPGGREELSDGSVISFWYPDNIREVVATGIEYHQTLGISIGKKGWRTLLDINGVFNRALNKNSISPVDRSEDKQLPYTPLHVVNGSWAWYYKTWDLSINTQFRSKRYVETNNELPALPEYMLWRFEIGKSGTVGPLHWQLRFRVNNAFNEFYETFENRAMPGRNYQLKLGITYN